MEFSSNETKISLHCAQTNTTADYNWIGGVSSYWSFSPQVGQFLAGYSIGSISSRFVSLRYWQGTEDGVNKIKPVFWEQSY